MLYHIVIRFKYDRKKSEKLKRDPRRKIGFKEVQEIWDHPHYVDCRADYPEQFRSIGWVKGNLYSVIYEIREDGDGEYNEDGEYNHLVTLWKSTRQEEKIYEKYS